MNAYEFSSQINNDRSGEIEWTEKVVDGPKTNWTQLTGRLIEDGFDCANFTYVEKKIIGTQSRASDIQARPGSDYAKMLAIPDVLYSISTGQAELGTAGTLPREETLNGRTLPKECRDKNTDALVTCNVYDISQVECTPFEATQIGITSLGASIASSNTMPDIYPGSIIQGKEIVNNIILPVTIPKGDAEVTITNVTLQGSSPLSAMLRPVSLATFQQAVQNLLYSGKLNATGAQINFTFKDITSKDELTAELGASGSGATGVSGGGSLNFTKTHNSNTVLMSLEQVWFTAQIAAPEYPAELFADGIDFVDRNSQMGPGNPPLYVRSVNYGRRIMVLVTSTESGQNIRAALNGAFATVPKKTIEGEPVLPLPSGKANIGGEMEKTLREAKIQVVVIGGSSAAGAKGLAVPSGVKPSEALFSLVQDHGELSRTNPAAVIGYSLAYLNDNKPAFRSTNLPRSLNNCSAISTQALSIKIEVDKIDNRFWIMTTKELERGVINTSKANNDWVMFRSKDLPHPPVIFDSSNIDPEKTRFLHLELANDGAGVNPTAVRYKIWVNGELKADEDLRGRRWGGGKITAIRNYKIGANASEFKEVSRSGLPGER